MRRRLGLLTMVPPCGYGDRMDWSSWGKRLETTLGGEGDFPALFAPGALFSDPVNAPTSDLAAIEEMTKASFPDWRQTIAWVHGDQTGGAFEWTGTGTFGGEGTDE